MIVMILISLFPRIRYPFNTKTRNHIKLEKKWLPQKLLPKSCYLQNVLKIYYLSYHFSKRHINFKPTYYIP